LTVRSRGTVRPFPRSSSNGSGGKRISPWREDVARKPETTPFTFLADIGERHVPGYNAPNFCDLMDTARGGNVCGICWAWWQLDVRKRRMLASLAVVQLPQRVSPGFYGSWVAD